MRLTVSSTAMMKPLLQRKDASLATPPPMRILGLLERRSDSHDRNQLWQKVVQYYRPHLQQPCLHTAQWGHFLEIINTNNDACVAVFGYEFDGANSWYQVWNSQTERSCWIRHHDDMSYQPYAIVAMDALVSLVPNWNGQLHAAPGQDDVSNTKIDLKFKSNDADRMCNVLVSDASTDANGHLWFLVTVKPAANTESIAHTTKTGWISPNRMR